MMRNAQRLRFVFEHAPLVLGQLEALIRNYFFDRRRACDEPRAAAGLSGGREFLATFRHRKRKAGEGLKTRPYEKRM
jgi:hypothetical protein